MSHCGVKSCDSNLNSSLRSMVSFFHFPQWEDSERFHMWAEALGKPPEHFKGRHTYICSRHFRQEDFSPESLPDNEAVPADKAKLRLLDNAVPSQYLCEDDKSTLKLSITAIKSSFPYSCAVDFIKQEKDQETQYKGLRDSLNDIDQTSGPSSCAPDYIVEGPQDEKINEFINDKDSSNESRLVIDTARESVNPARGSLEALCSVLSKPSEDPEIKEFQCKQCGESFAWANQLRKHRRLVHGTYKCNICLKYISSAGSMKTHKKSRHNISLVFSCELCDEAFFRARELLKHIKIHKSIERRRCPKCKKKLETQDEIQSQKCKRCNKMSQCEVCKKWFLGEIILKVHMTRTHLKKEEEEKNYACDLCKKTFKKAYNLSLHKLHHEKPFQCKTCNRRFSTKNLLAVHELDHSAVECVHLGCMKY